MNVIILMYPCFGGWIVEYVEDKGTSVAGGEMRDKRRF